MENQEESFTLGNSYPIVEDFSDLDAVESSPEILVKLADSETKILNPKVDKEVHRIAYTVCDNSSEPNIVRFRQGNELLNSYSGKGASRVLRNSNEVSKEALRNFHEKNGELFHQIKSEDPRVPNKVLCLGYPNKSGAQRLIRELNNNAKQVAKEVFGENIVFIPLYASHSNDYWFFHKSTDDLQGNSSPSGQTVPASGQIHQLQSNINGFGTAKLSEIESIPGVCVNRIIHKYDARVLKILKEDYSLSDEQIRTIIERDISTALYEAADLERQLFRGLENSQKGLLFLVNKALGQTSRTIVTGVQYIDELRRRQSVETYKAGELSMASNLLDGSNQALNENKSSDFTESIARFGLKRERNFSQGLDIVKEMVLRTVQNDVLHEAIKNTPEGSVFDVGTPLNKKTMNLCHDISTMAENEKSRLSAVFQNNAILYGEATACYDFSPEGESLNTEESFWASQRSDIYNRVKDPMISLSDATQLITQAEQYKISLNGKSRVSLEVEQNEQSIDFMRFINDKVVPLSSKRLFK